MVATALLMSFGTTSPRYSIMQAMYFPALGSQTTIWLVGSKQAAVSWSTLCDSWPDLEAAITGARVSKERSMSTSTKYKQTWCPTPESTTLLSPLPLLSLLPSLATSRTAWTNSLQPALNRPTRWSSVTPELGSTWPA